MSKLTHCELRNGIWSGRLEGSADAPNVIATYQGVEIADMSVTPISGNIWSLELPLPLEKLSDGVHSCLIFLETGEKIGDFTVIAGEVLADDLRAEIARLRRNWICSKLLCGAGWRETRGASAPRSLRLAD